MFNTSLKLLLHGNPLPGLLPARGSHFLLQSAASAWRPLHRYLCNFLIYFIVICFFLIFPWSPLGKKTSALLLVWRHWICDEPLSSGKVRKPGVGGEEVPHGRVSRHAYPGKILCRNQMLICHVPQGIFQLDLKGPFNETLRCRRMSIYGRVLSLVLLE